jgi:hypothetical protein
MKTVPNPAGYSGTPLPKKLGIKEGQQLAFLNAPEGYVRSLIGDTQHETTLGEKGVAFDLIQFFTAARGEYEAALPDLKLALAKTGSLWISWPKKAAGVATDLNENIVRDLALEAGLVDVKVCAVDGTWSGLKLVYRVKDR